MPIKVYLNEKVTLDRRYRLYDQDGAADVMCAAALIAARELPADATIQNAFDYYWDTIGSDCGACPARGICAACVINE
jgi:hypothetical protein